MQEIFYNGKIITNNEKNEIAQAMLINDGSVVYVGCDEEVLNLKTDGTKLTDLQEKYVYPSLFDFDANVFEKIDEKIKNANQDKKLQNLDEINENYDNFQDYEEYKKEYLELEKEYIKKGIATIVEMKIDRREFAFWKKMSDEKQLKLDVIAYVDMVTSKQVMDDNCVTYRKYRNHFRLGGYYLKIDGKIHELKAWLKKTYTGTKSHYGSSEFYGEQLHYFIKTALEEKKQILFEVNGDKAVEEVLTVLEEVEKQDKITNFYRPIFYGSNLIEKKTFLKLKHFDITLLLEEFDDGIEKNIRKFIGLFRRKKFHNYNQLIKNDIRFILINHNFEKQSFDSLMSCFFVKKRKIIQKMLKNSEYYDKNVKNLSKFTYLNPAYVCFDQDTKLSLETQKQASFVCLNKSVLSANFDFEKELNCVYLNGEKQF